MASTVPRPSEQRVYVQTLERKVADLESRLRHAESLVDHCSQEGFRVAGVVPESSLSRTIRDLSLNASGSSYLGATSNIALARLLEPVLHTDKGTRRRQGGAGSDEVDNGPSVSQNLPVDESEDALDVSTFSEPVVDKLFQAYMEYISLPFPIIHSRKLRDMHNRRAKPNGLFEVCVLHLVYAIGGASLTLVWQMIPPPSTPILMLPVWRQGQFQSR